MEGVEPAIGLDEEDVERRPARVLAYVRPTDPAPPSGATASARSTTSTSPRSAPTAAVTIPQGICMHEEDGGILWKHTDFRTGVVEVRRGRKLVISSIVTVGNYEYGFFWYLQQDGMIQCEIKATGIVATQAVTENAPTEYGKLVAPHLDGDQPGE